jgi:hypothetical protein
MPTYLFRRAVMLALLIALTVLSGCAVTDVHRGEPLASQADWVLLPIANHSETPLAGQKAQASLMTLLHQHGVRALVQAPRAAPTGLINLPSDRDYRAALAWAPCWPR